MSSPIENNRKRNENLLTLSFLKEMSKKDNLSKKEITIDSNSNEIAEIISNKLLKEVQKQLILK